MRKLLLLPKLVLTLSLIVIVSCKTLEVHDAEGCGDLGPEGAHCSHTLIDSKRDIPKEQWDIERVGWICFDSTDFNSTETSLDQACVLLKCTYKEKQMLQDINDRLKEVMYIASTARLQQQRENFVRMKTNYCPEGHP